MKNTSGSMLCLWLIIFFTSCVEQVDIEKYIKSKPTSKLVVEGLITDERKQHLVKLSRPGKALPDEPYDVVTGALLTISDGNTVFNLTEDPALPGNYLTDSIKGEVGRVYTLKISIANELYEATDSMVQTKPFGRTDGVVLGSNQPPKGYIQTPLIIFGSDAPSMITTMIDNPAPNDKYTELNYYAFPGIDPDNVLPKSVEASLSYNEGTQITQLKYSLSQTHYHFLRALLLETEYKGGVLGSVRSNTPTNVSSGAYGFFGASSVTRRTGTIGADGKLH